MLLHKPHFTHHTTNVIPRTRISPTKKRPITLPVTSTQVFAASLLVVFCRFESKQ